VFRKLALSGRIIATVGGIVAVFLGVCLWLTASHRSAAYEAKRTAIRQLVEVGEAVVAHYVGLEERGVLTPDEARRQASEALKGLRYDKDQYFWINDMQPKMIMHPTNAGLNGKDLTDYKDPTGKRLFVEMTAVARKDGAGLVEYQWPKPGSTDPEPKFSYVKRVARWDWLVGSGIYVDNVEREVRATLWITEPAGPATKPPARAKVLQLKTPARPRRTAPAAEAQIPMDDSGTYGRF